MVSLWRGKRLVGFGRATSDGCSRAVLWDIVVAGDLKGHGLGRRVIDELLHTARGGRGTGVSDDYQECWLLPATGLQDAYPNN